jgi:hypothetical protein
MRRFIAQFISFRGECAMIFPLAVLALFSSQPSTLGLLIGFAMGFLLFYFGFRTYREYRIFEDTPLAPIRSIPMGLVHVQGKTTGGEPLTSPLTGVPCYYYDVEVEKYVQKDKGSSWETVRRDREERNFILEDATGKVLVNPHLAEYEVTRTFHAQTGKIIKSGRFIEPSLGVKGPSDQDLLAYLNDTSRAQAALAAMNVPGAKTAGKILGATQKLGSMGISLGGAGLEVGWGTHQYRFTEHCLLVGRDCNILGTCAENPAPQDEHDRNIIMKGQNEKTFLVTTNTEGQEEKSLRRKAFLLIFLGGAIIVGMAAITLNAFGLL